MSVNVGYDLADMTEILGLLALRYRVKSVLRLLKNVGDLVLLGIRRVGDLGAHVNKLTEYGFILYNFCIVLDVECVGDSLRYYLDIVLAARF